MPVREGRAPPCRFAAPCAAMPEGAKTGRLGAIIFKPKKGGGW